MFFAALAISYRVGHPEGSTGNKRRDLNRVHRDIHHCRSGNTAKREI
jgi:hypothetical protein